MLFTYLPLSVFKCPSVLCSSAHAWHKSVPNLQCKYTPNFFLQSKQNLFSFFFFFFSFSSSSPSDAAGEVNTDSCIVWRMKQFLGPIASPKRTFCVVFFFFFFFFFFKVVVVIVVVVLTRSHARVLKARFSEFAHVNVKREREKEKGRAQTIK